MGHGGKREQQLGDGGGSWETTAAAGRARAAASGKEYVRSNKMILASCFNFVFYLLSIELELDCCSIVDWIGGQQQLHC